MMLKSTPPDTRPLPLRVWENLDRQALRRFPDDKVKRAAWFKHRLNQIQVHGKCMGCRDRKPRRDHATAGGCSACVGKSKILCPRERDGYYTKTFDLSKKPEAVAHGRWDSWNEYRPRRRWAAPRQAMTRNARNAQALVAEGERIDGIVARLEATADWVLKVRIPVAFVQGFDS